MLLNTNTKPGQKMEVRVTQFVSSNGSADSSRHREWFEKIFNFHQETKMLHLIQECHIFCFDPDAWETFYSELLIPLEGSVCCLILFQKRKHGNSMISHKWKLQV